MNTTLVMGKSILLLYLLPSTWRSLGWNTVLSLTDNCYQQVRHERRTRETFFDDVRALLLNICFESWDADRSFMIQGLLLTSLNSPTPTRVDTKECNENERIFIISYKIILEDWPKMFPHPESINMPVIEIVKRPRKRGRPLTKKSGWFNRFLKKFGTLNKKNIRS